MAVVAGKFHHGDGTFDLAIAVPEAQGDEKGGNHVVRFVEDGGSVDHQHNVPTGTGDGEFSE